MPETLFQRLFARKRDPTLLGDFGIVDNGDHKAEVALASRSPLEASDLERMVGPQRAASLAVHLESDRGQTLIEHNEVTSLNLSEAEWFLAFHEMRYDDAVADALNTLFSRLHTYPYYVRPASLDPEDVRIAAFVTDQLGIGYSSFAKYPAFRRLLDVFELALIYGKGAAAEMVLSPSGRLAVLDKLVPIHPFHIVDIERDAKGGPRSLVVEGTTLAGAEQAPQTRRVKLPFAKVVYFAYKDHGTLRGESLLRPAYLPWRIKRAMLKLVNAGYERFLLGIPVLKVPKSVMPGTKEWALAENTLKLLAAKPRSGTVLPEGWELTIEVVNSQMPDAQPYIVRQDLAIKRALGVGFTSVGTDAAGSNYKASEKLSGVTESFGYDLALQFCEFVNLYFVNRLVYVNFPHVDRYPYLTILRSNQADPSAVLNAFSQMVSASRGPNGLDAEQYQAVARLAPRMIREMLGLEEDEILRLVEEARRSVR
jgi:hypothetical protein